MVLLSQLDESCTSAALIGWGGKKTSDMRMAAKQAGNRATQCAGAVAVYDAHLAEARERCFVEKLIHRIDRFVSGLADDVQFRLDLLFGGGKMDLSAG